MAARYAKLSKIFAACTEIWHKRPIPLHQKQKKELKKHTVMRNTEYTLDKLASMISSESSFTALVEMMGDMGLEFEGAVKGQ